MKHVVIADASKPSVVIISEILKDNFEQVSVSVYNNGKDVLDHLKTNPCDLLVTEFFLADMDGVTMVKKIKKTSNIPVIFTTFYNEDFFQMFEEELFTYADCYEVQLKPIKPNDFKMLAERYLYNSGRMSRRFYGNYPVEIANKKRKGKGKNDSIAMLKNISLDGFCLQHINPETIQENEPIQFGVNLTTEESQESGKSKKPHLSMNGEIRWVDKEKNEAGGILKTSTKNEKDDLLKFFKKMSMNTRTQERVTK